MSLVRKVRKALLIYRALLYIGFRKMEDFRLHDDNMLNFVVIEFSMNHWAREIVN